MLLLFFSLLSPTPSLIINSFYSLTSGSIDNITLHHGHNSFTFLPLRPPKPLQHLQNDTPFLSLIPSLPQIPNSKSPLQNLLFFSFPIPIFFLNIPKRHLFPTRSIPHTRRTQQTQLPRIIPLLTTTPIRYSLGSSHERSRSGPHRMFTR